MDAIPTLEFDAYGFLRDPSRWDEAVAMQIAAHDGIGALDATQLEVLRRMRACYERSGTLPAWYHVCHQTGLDPHCLSRLFPSPREAWRLAGLPYPGEEALAYL
jgi:tRNA 2-thiouridine synthesizing protein E